MRNGVRDARTAARAGPSKITNYHLKCTLEERLRPGAAALQGSACPRLRTRSQFCRLKARLTRRSANPIRACTFLSNNPSQDLALINTDITAEWQISQSTALYGFNHTRPTQSERKQ
ncbi:hypothetical protein EVAR_32875_1 [Eumeta japonica]|uniref:Uncharacterized protein n=1 Tax=Eumeta variegata TaxID=151549 RepID=A0A4C1VTB2_EUMVA|nr:hypothetical protein EVAR_32875_1 [Eumeta japonica]